MSERPVEELLTPAEIEKRMRRVAGRLMEAIDEHGKVCSELAEAEADYAYAYNMAHLASFDEHEDGWSVGRHESHAKSRAHPQFYAFKLLERRERALREEMHSLRQVLSSLQSHQKYLAELAR